MADLDDTLPTAAIAADVELTKDQIWAELRTAEETGATPEPTPAADPFPSEDTPDQIEPDPTHGQTDEDATAQTKRLEHALKSDRGRLKTANEEIRQLRADLAASHKTVQARTDDTTLAEQRKKLDATRAEYGDVIGPVVDTLDMVQRSVDRLDAQEAQNIKTKGDRYNALVLEQEQVFKTEHPDGFDVLTKNGPAFLAWIEDQPKVLRDSFAANKAEIVDGTSAAFLVSKFKEALSGASAGNAPAHQTDSLQSRRASQLDGARSVRQTTPQAVPGPPDKDSTDKKAHWDYFAAMDRAKSG